MPAEYHYLGCLPAEQFVPSLMKRLGLHYYAGLLTPPSETYKATGKVTFFKGGYLDDPSKLFNASLVGKTRRAIDFREGDKIDEQAFKALIRAAVALNSKE